ncbi:MAG: hypothetical protein E7214_14570 [Clostridium sp.]|nr:hypothetical protein [Clostridium sp.]
MYHYYGNLRKNHSYLSIYTLRPRICLRLPSDSTSRWTPLPLTSGSHYQAHNGLSPSSCCPCWAHK